MTTEALDEIARTIAKYGERHSLWRQLRRLDEKHGEEALDRLLWEGFRADAFEVVYVLQVVERMPQRAATHGIEDAVALLQRFAAAFPEGEQSGPHGSHCLWSDEEVPGLIPLTAHIVTARKDDPAAVAALREAVATLPAPYDQGLALSLAQAGVLASDALPAGTLEVVAIRDVEHGSDSFRAVWTEDVYRAALAAALRRAQRCTPSALAALAGHVPAEELLEAVGRSVFGGDDWKTVEALAPLGRDSFDAVAAAAEGCVGAVGAPAKMRADSYELGWPAYFRTCIYLRACKHHGREPAPWCDALVGGLLDGFELHWSGSNYLGYLAELRETLAVLPVPRLAPLLVAAAKVPWLLAAAAPTPEVVARILEALHALPRPLAWREKTAVEHCLKTFGPEQIPALNAAVGRPGAQRGLVIEALIAAGTAETVPGLIQGLYDKAKRVRDRAEEGLAALDDVVDALEAPLHAGARDVRIVAARLLARQPATARRHALAQARLEVEKAAAVRAVLETIAAPPSGGDEGAALAAALGEDLRAWQRFPAVGDDRLEILWNHLLQVHQGDVIADVEPWLELLAVAKRHPRAREWAILGLIFSRSSDARRSLEVALGLWPDFLASLAEHIRTHGWRRTPAMGTCKSWRTLGLDAMVSTAHGLEAGGRTGLWLACADVSRSARQYLLTLPVDERLRLGERLLTSAVSRERRLGAELLESTGRDTVLPLLERAHKREKDRFLKSALLERLSAVALRSLKVAAYGRDEAGERALDQALAALPRARKNPAWSARLPTLRLASGAALSKGARGWFLQQLDKEGPRHNPELRALRERLEPASRRAFLATLLRRAKTGPTRGVPLAAIAILGGPDDVETLRKELPRLAASRQDDYGAPVCRALARLGLPEAVQVLDVQSRSGRTPALKRRAGSALAGLARRQGCSVEELVDNSLGDGGFGPDRCLRLDFGPRSFTARLTAEGSIVLVDEASGKERKALPKPRKSDDPERAAAARKQLSAARKTVRRTLSARKKRWQQAMLAAQEEPVEAFAARTLGNPIWWTAAQGLLFAVKTGEGWRSFLLDEDGRPCDRDGPLRLPAAGVVRVVHPVQLEEEEAERWRELLDEKGLEPRFVQLERKIFRLDELPESAEELLRELPLVTGHDLYQAARARGYEPGPIEDGGAIYRQTKTVGPFAWTVAHGGVFPGHVSDHEDCELRSIEVRKDGEKIPWRTLPPELFSELAFDLYALSGSLYEVL